MALAGAVVMAGCGREGPPARQAVTETATPPPPSPTVAPAPTTALPLGPDAPNEIRMEVLGDASEGDVQEVFDAAMRARDFYYRKLGFYVDGPVTINVANLPGLPIHGVTFQSEGDRISSITINVGQATWVAESAAERSKVVAHEYFHVLQDWLRGGSDPPQEVFFLVEGGAEYAGYATVVDAGAMTHLEFQRTMIDWLRLGGAKLPALDQLSAQGEVQYRSYVLSALAVDLLVGASGIRPLGEYFALRRTEAVDRAFEAVFHRTPQSFYADFALWRATQGI